MSTYIMAFNPIGPKMANPQTEQITQAFAYASRSIGSPGVTVTVGGCFNLPLFYALGSHENFFHVFF